MLTLKVLRSKANQTQASVAKAIGVDRTTYAKYESGASEPSFEMLQRMAKFYNVSVGYIMGEAETPANSGYIRVPVLGRVAAGIPIEAIEDIVGWEDISKVRYGSGEYFGLQIQGHSMEPKISDGDVVIVRRQQDVDSGDIAVVLVNCDDATVKKVKKSPQGVTLIPSNPAYEPMYYTNAEIESLPVQILGRVVELRAKF